MYPLGYGFLMLCIMDFVESLSVFERDMVPLELPADVNSAGYGAFNERYGR